MANVDKTAEQLFGLIHKALLGNVPNFGGHHGMHGMMRGLREELMKQTGLVCGKLKSATLTDNDQNEYIALCETAVATEVLAENDLKKIISILQGGA